MAAWKLSGKGGEAEAGDWTGFLDKGVKVEGTLEVQGTFRFDAKMKGTIISAEALILGESTDFEGQIQGNHVTVSGRVRGAIHAKGKVEIQAKGMVNGEIHTPCLVIEAGGTFDGKCHMTGSTAGESAQQPLTIPLRPATEAK
jgi:cytoskeletal protein CcmA (bactofilin family)